MKPITKNSIHCLKRKLLTSRNKFSFIKFTLVEMLVVIAIISILSSVMMPALSKAMQSTYNIKCMGNLRQLNYGVLQYADDYDGMCPSYSGWGYGSQKPWQTEVTPYLGAQTKIDISNGNDSWIYHDGTIWKPVSLVFLCPSQETETTNKQLIYGKHYGINFDMSWPTAGNNNNIRKVAHPSKRFLLADIDTDSNTEATAISNNSMFGVRHVNESNTNISFADGHTESLIYLLIPLRGQGVYFWGWRCSN